MEDTVFSRAAAARTGSGTESDPYVSADGTAGIGAELAELKRGGRVSLKCARYDVTQPITIDTPSVCLAGEVWSYSSDPNGVFESEFGTKIRKKNNALPAICIGKTRTLGGNILSDIGVYGDIEGMDTRGKFDPANPTAEAGVVFDSVRVDQAELVKMSFCGLGVGISVCGNAEPDAVNFTNLNLDGCCVGLYFAPAYACYDRFTRLIFADTPAAGMIIDGRGRNYPGLEIHRCHFVRNAGDSRTAASNLPANAALVVMANKASITECVVDNPGVFWFYPDRNTPNGAHRDVVCPSAVGIYLEGNQSRLSGNRVSGSKAESAIVRGNGNVLVGNTSDGDVTIEGENNIVCAHFFTSASARLVLKGTAAARSTQVYAVPPERIVRMP